MPETLYVVQVADTNHCVLGYIGRECLSDTTKDDIKGMPPTKVRFKLRPGLIPVETEAGLTPGAIKYRDYHKVIPDIRAMAHEVGNGYLYTIVPIHLEWGKPATAHLAPSF